jgi:hypothetical protein
MSEYDLNAFKGLGMDQSSYLAKVKHRVHIILTNKEVLDGFIFTMHDERIVDLMNDKRGFIPFHHGDRKNMIVLNKEQIRSIENRQEKFHL